MDDSPWMPPSSGSSPSPDVPQAASPLEPPPLAPPPPPVSPWARDGLEPPPGLVPDDAPVVEPVVTELKPRRSKAVLIGAVVAVLAVGAAGVFAVSRFRDSAQGGAGTPSDLGAALFSAMENEDLLGATDLLLPGERDLFKQPMIDYVAELSRLEVLTPDADLANIEGIDIVLGDTSVVAHATNVTDIVNLDLHAEVSTTVDGEAFPIGDLITDNMDPDDVADIRGTVETSTDELDETLTAVEQDGRWYFSIFYTVAEVARADIGSDIPEQGIGADGGDSPEAAFDLMLDRIEALDVAGMIRDLNPGEAAALQRYAPLFLDDAEAAVSDVPFEVQITDRKFHIDGDGDQRTVVIDGVTIRVTGDDEDTGESHSAEIRLEGSCTHATIDDETFDLCAGDTSSIPEVDEYLSDSPSVAAFVDTLGEALSDLEPIGVEVRQYDGAWFVSPTATYTEAMLAVLRALDRHELDQLIALYEPAADELFGNMFGLGEYDEYSDDDYSDDDYSYDTTYDTSYGDEMAPITVPDMGYDDSFGDLSGDAQSAEASPWDDCYAEEAAADAAACFQQYVATGELDETFVPLPLRFPECGYAEISWSGELYGMSDADFIAAVEAARPCFLALVAAGTLDQYELPTEIAHLECLEGRNWYNTYDDPEYDERYYDCLASADES